MSDFVFGDVVYPRMRMSYLSVDGEEEMDLIPEYPGGNDYCCRCRKVLEGKPACKLSSMHVASNKVSVIAYWMFLCVDCTEDLRVFLNIKTGGCK